MENTEETVWIERDEMLDTMGLVAYMQAAGRMSEKGKEVLAMLSQVDYMARLKMSDMSTVDAFRELKAYEDLDDNDQIAIETYVARAALIEHFRDYAG